MQMDRDADRRNPSPTKKKAARAECLSLRLSLLRAPDTGAWHELGGGYAQLRTQCPAGVRTGHWAFRTARPRP